MNIPDPHSPHDMTDLTGRTVIPLVEEQIELDRRLVETGYVRIHKTVTEEQVLVEQPVEETQVQVERVAINRFIDAAPPVRTEGDTTIIPVIEEVIVVEKRLMLKEEVRLTRHTSTKTSRQTVTLRTEQAEVQRDHPDSPDNRPPPLPA